MRNYTVSGVKTSKASSPGQIFLFGEHAVVYGQPALATAIDIRAEARAEPVPNKLFKIRSEGVGQLDAKIKKRNGNWSVCEKKGDIKKLEFVSKAAELTINHVDKAQGLKIFIESGIPLGSGLGSSSAVTTATIAAVSKELGKKLSREKISQLAYETELGVQGAASRTGVSVASYGGFLRVQDENVERLEGLPELDIVIGYTGEYGNTGELVAGVKGLKDSRPALINPIIESIGKTADMGIESLREKNLGKVGVLMNTNQNLLEGLGVSSPDLRDLIAAAREAGARGAKLTGAGGGGCMIALKSKEDRKIYEAIKKEGGEPMQARTGAKGVRF